MKKWFFLCFTLSIIFAILCSSVYASEMIIRKEGKDWAEISADGTVIINKKIACQIGDDGTVKINGKVAGKIDHKTGEIIKNDKPCGQLDFDGRIHIGGEVVWKLGSTIRKNEIEWGKVTNFNNYNDMVRIATVLIFFGD